MTFDPLHPSNSVSVIIPVHNGARFIAETLRTISEQTVPPTEMIVVNDGSTDDSQAIIKEFRNVSLINTRNQGVCEARNTGASQARGNWLAFCDHDDLWVPTKLEQQLRLANEAPEIHCVLTDYAEITDGVLSSRSHLSYAPENFWAPERYEAGYVVRTPITGKLTTFQPGITSASIVKREFYQNVGGFDAKASHLGSEDTCFHFRCLSVVPFGVVPKVLMHYRRHPGAMSADTLKQLRDTITVWDYILAEYPQAQPYHAELIEGLKAMRKEFAEDTRYRRRQKLKRLLHELVLKFRTEA
jgi:glycosyltransferase involved in cell wall biosynthesis